MNTVLVRCAACLCGPRLTVDWRSVLIPMQWCPCIAVYTWWPWQGQSSNVWYVTCVKWHHIYRRFWRRRRNEGCTWNEMNTRTARCCFTSTHGVTYQREWILEPGRKKNLLWVSRDDFSYAEEFQGRYQWPRGLRRGSAASLLPGLRVRITPRSRLSSVVIVVCCQVEISTTGWSLVQKSPTDCGASFCVI